jgi:hypothetical protein
MRDTNIGTTGAKAAPAPKKRGRPKKEATKIKEAQEKVFSLFDAITFEFPKEIAPDPAPRDKMSDVEDQLEAENISSEWAKVVEASRSLTISQMANLANMIISEGLIEPLDLITHKTVLLTGFSPSVMGIANTEQDSLTSVMRVLYLNVRAITDRLCGIADALEDKI